MRNLISLVVAAGILGMSQANVTTQTLPFGRRLVGTWELSSLQRIDRAGVAASVPNPLGVLIQDSAGRVIQIVTRGGRPAFASGTPTPVEAQQAFSTYSGFWGSYRADEKAKTITYRFDGHLNAGLVGKQQQQSIEAATDDGLTISYGQNGETVRATWQRVPDLETMTPAQKELVGFWQWVSEERVAENGSVVAATSRNPSVIAYSPAGYVAVHFDVADRKALAGATPTLEEALDAIRGVFYFGIYVVQPERGYLYHHRLSVMMPGQAGDTLQRFFRITGSQVVLRFPPQTANGQTVRNVVTLKRLGSLRDFESR